MVRLLLVVAVIALAFVVARRLGARRLRFVGGQLVECSGAVPPRLRASFAEIARRSDLTGVVTLHGRDRLTFSLGVGEGDRQRFRNAMQVT